MKPPMTAGPIAFYFRQRYGKLNWGKLARIDVDEVVREVDLEVLQSVVDDIAFCRVQEGDLAALAGADGLSVKLVRLAQLVIEYLLHVQERQEHAVGNLVGQLDSANKRNEELQSDVALAGGSAAALQREAQHYQSALHTCGNLLRQYGIDAGPILQSLAARSMPPFTFVQAGQQPHVFVSAAAAAALAKAAADKAGALPPPVMAPPSTAPAAGGTARAARVCKACGKAFVSLEFLAKHMARRHRGFSVPTAPVSTVDAGTGEGAAGDDDDEADVVSGARRLSMLVAEARDREKDAAIAALRAELDRMKDGGVEKRRRRVQAMLRLRALLLRRATGSRHGLKAMAFDRWKAAAIATLPRRHRVTSSVAQSVQTAAPPRPPPAVATVAVQGGRRLVLGEVLAAVHRRVDLAVDAQLGPADAPQNAGGGGGGGDGYAAGGGWASQHSRFLVNTTTGHTLQSNWRVGAADVEAARQQALAELYDRGRRLGLDMRRGHLDDRTYTQKLAEATVRREKLLVPEIHAAFQSVEDEVEGLHHRYYHQGTAAAEPPDVGGLSSTVSYQPFGGGRAGNAGSSAYRFGGTAASSAFPFGGTATTQRSGGLGSGGRGGSDSYSGGQLGPAPGLAGASALRGPLCAGDKEEEARAIARRSGELDSEHWRRRDSLMQAERDAAAAAVAAAAAAALGPPPPPQPLQQPLGAGRSDITTGLTLQHQRNGDASMNGYGGGQHLDGAAMSSAARAAAGSSAYDSRNGPDDGGGFLPPDASRRTPQYFPDVELPRVDAGDRHRAAAAGDGAVPTPKSAARAAARTAAIMQRTVAVTASAASAGESSRSRSDCREAQLIPAGRTADDWNDVGPGASSGSGVAGSGLQRKGSLTVGRHDVSEQPPAPAEHGPQDDDDWPDINRNDVVMEVEKAAVSTAVHVMWAARQEIPPPPAASSTAVEALPPAGPGPAAAPAIKQPQRRAGGLAGFAPSPDSQPSPQRRRDRDTMPGTALGTVQEVMDVSREISSSDHGSIGYDDNGGGGGRDEREAVVEMGCAESVESDWDNDEPANSPGRGGRGAHAAAPDRSHGNGDGTVETEGRGAGAGAQETYGVASTGMAATDAAATAAEAAALVEAAPKPFQSRYGGFVAGARLSQFPRRLTEAAPVAAESMLARPAEDIEIEDVV